MGVDDFVQELIHSIVNNTFRVAVLLKIGKKIGYLFVNGWPGGAGDVGAVQKGGDGVEFEWMRDEWREVSTKASVCGFSLGASW